MISPTISIESFIEPIQLTRPSTREGGMTSAIGLPKRVTRIGFLVLQTCSKRDRHVALNSEIATSCIGWPVVKQEYDKVGIRLTHQAPIGCGLPSVLPSFGCTIR